MLLSGANEDQSGLELSKTQDFGWRRGFRTPSDTQIVERVEPVETLLSTHGHKYYDV